MLQTKQQIAFPNHDEVFRQLITGTVCSDISDYIFHRYKKGSKIYSRGAYKIRESLSPERQAETRKKYIEHDVILTLYTLNKRKGKYAHQKHKTVSIEIKTTKGDLEEAFKRGSHDFKKYMGATDYFFIAVPSHLLSVLIKLHQRHVERKYIGIIDASSGLVVVMPREQAKDENREHNVLSHCLTSAENLVEFETGMGLFSLRRVGTVSGKDFFCQCACIQGLIVNHNYYGYYD